MALSPQWLDQLRTRVTLSTVVMRTTKLQRAGREWRACCPFHDEKTPSFYVNDQKGFYHCFGCGAHGDVIRWMTDQRGLQFMDAVKELLSGPKSKAFHKLNADTGEGAGPTIPRRKSMSTAGGITPRGNFNAGAIAAKDASKNGGGLGVKPAVISFDSDRVVCHRPLKRQDLFWQRVLLRSHARSLFC